MPNEPSIDISAGLGPEGLQQPPQPATAQQGESPEYVQLAGLISDLDRRIRVLEERYNNIRKKIQLTDQNLLESEKSFSKELRSLNGESLDLKRTVNDFSDKLMMFSGEMSDTAKKADLMVVEKYLAMWNPVNFVTRKELREYLENKGIRTGLKDGESEEN
jgi:hypothetical protein